MPTGNLGERNVHERARIHRELELTRDCTMPVPTGGHREAYGSFERPGRATGTSPGRSLDTLWRGRKRCQDEKAAFLTPMYCFWSCAEQTLNYEILQPRTSSDAGSPSPPISKQGM